MGAWSEHSFGNDTSCDWIYTFLENPGLPIVDSTIQVVLKAEDYLDSDEASECLAACEVIARLQGKWGLRDSYSEELDQWIEANPTPVPDELRISADQAIQRILAPNSELQQLWDEDGLNEDWHKAIEDLRERIKG